MSVVVAFPRRPGPMDGYEVIEVGDDEGFDETRRAMLRALQRWLATGPDPVRVEIEIAGTINSLRSLVDLVGGPPDAAA